MTSQGSNAYIEDISDLTESPIPENEKSNVVEFFAHTNVLVTGGTGFLGKLIVEKLLRSCPGIVTLYMPVRPKKGKTAAERFKENFEDVVYDRLKKERPDSLKKVVMLESELTQEDLGVSPEVRNELLKLNVIIHAAATVRFDETIRVATNINVKSIKNLLLFAQQLPQLKAFVHVSTAFSHCILNNIDEKHYESPIDVDKLITLSDVLDDEQLEYLKPKIIGKWPNTYAFSKAVGEHTVLKYSKNLPACIVRPSIIIATKKEPVSAWINNVYGATGVVVGGALGLLRSLYCMEEYKAEVIPADYVVNNVITSAWEVADRKAAAKQIKESDVPNEEKVPIYNCVSSCQKPISWGDFMRRNEYYGFDVPSTKVFWFYMFILTRSSFTYKICDFFLHLLPALIFDTISYLLGRKPMLYNLYKKVGKFSTVINYFTTRKWQFYNNNVVKLWDKLNSADRRLFDFNVADLDWEDYFYLHVRGIRQYILKDPLDTVPEARAKYQQLRIVHYTVSTLAILLFVWLTWCFVKLLWSFCPLAH